MLHDHDVDADIIMQVRSSGRYDDDSHDVTTVVAEKMKFRPNLEVNSFETWDALKEIYC